MPITKNAARTFTQNKWEQSLELGKNEVKHNLIAAPSLATAFGSASHIFGDELKFRKKSQKIIV